MGSLRIQESFFELGFQKIEALLVQIFHIQKKTVLFSQNSQAQSAHQFKFSSLDFALCRLFFVSSKIGVFGSILTL